MKSWGLALALMNSSWTLHAQGADEASQAVSEPAPPQYQGVEGGESDKTGTGSSKDNFASSGETTASAEAEDEPKTEKKEEEARSVRGSFGIGFQVATASGDLSEAANSFGLGAQFHGALGPVSWPVLFGAQFEFANYSGPSKEFTYQGQAGSYSLDTLSHLGQVFVRLQPWQWALNPYLDVLGGYWSLGVSVTEPLDIFGGDLDGRIGSSLAGVYGVRVGADILLSGRKGKGLMFLSLGLQWTRGGTFSIPDTASAEVVGGEIQFPNDVRIESPTQLQFMISLAGVSNNEIP